ncbi:putative uncharacterized protein ENSP00000383309 [Elgaria multicarinata webbii]|uniref:putative uncharacterized protein ENSP00000383309 n=1 Tax=Elgaria multicarinata webbii TaxID=159646 RepID=UPI002FCCEAEA
MSRPPSASRSQSVPMASVPTRPPSLSEGELRDSASAASFQQPPRPQTLQGLIPLQPSPRMTPRREWDGASRYSDPQPRFEDYEWDRYRPQRYFPDRQCPQEDYYAHRPPTTRVCRLPLPSSPDHQTSRVSTPQQRIQPSGSTGAVPTRPRSLVGTLLQDCLRARVVGRAYAEEQRGLAESAYISRSLSRFCATRKSLLCGLAPGARAAEQTRLAAGLVLPPPSWRTLPSPPSCVKKVGLGSRPDRKGEAASCRGEARRSAREEPPLPAPKRIRKSDDSRFQQGGRSGGKGESRTRRRASRVLRPGSGGGVPRALFAAVLPPLVAALSAPDPGNLRAPALNGSPTAALIGLPPSALLPGQPASSGSLPRARAKGEGRPSGLRSVRLARLQRRRRQEICVRRSPGRELLRGARSSGRPRSPVTLAHPGGRLKGRRQQPQQQRQQQPAASVLFLL